MINEEIKNALTTILILFGVLKRRALDPEITQAIEIMYDAAKAMKKTLEHLGPVI